MLPMSRYESFWNESRFLYQPQFTRRYSLRLRLSAYRVTVLTDRCLKQFDPYLVIRMMETGFLAVASDRCQHFEEVCCDVDSCSASEGTRSVPGQGSASSQAWGSNCPLLSMPDS